MPVNIGAQVIFSEYCALIDYVTEEHVECITIYGSVPHPGMTVIGSATFRKGDLALVLEKEYGRVVWCKIILESSKVGWCEERWLEEIT